MAQRVEDTALQLRVLVAEDHPVNRQYMAALLEGMGHLCSFAGNGLEALEAIRVQAFDMAQANTMALALVLCSLAALAFVFAADRRGGSVLKEAAR